MGVWRATTSPVERGGNILQGFRGIHLKNGSSQRQKLALTVLLTDWLILTVLTLSTADLLDPGKVQSAFEGGD